MSSENTQPIRKRMRRWEAAGGARFVTFSCQRRLPLLGHPAIRDVFFGALATAKQRHGFELYAWVVMPEHVHLMVRPREDAALADALRPLKTSVARRVVGRWRGLEASILEEIRTDRGDFRYWQQGGGFDRNVRDIEEFCREVRYIHRNPVGRGLVERSEDWRWSSVRWWMGDRDGELPCDQPPGDPAAWAAWRGFV